MIVISKNSRTLQVMLFTLVAFCLIPLHAMAANWGYSGSKPVTEDDHLLHMQDSMYYMEQWSASTYFGKDHSLHVNLIYSKMTTKSKKGVFRVEYNTPDGKQIVDNERCELKITQNPLTFSCGKGKIIGPMSDLAIVWKGDKLPVLMKLKALAPPFRPGNGRLTSPDDSDDFYDFMLSVPRAKTVAKLKGEVLRGYSMVDHSYTNIGLHKISRHFVRSTNIDNDISVIFAANWLKDGRYAGWISITDNQGHSFSTTDLTFTFSDLWNDPDKAGYFAPKSIAIESKGQTPFSLKLKNMNFVRKKDMLSNLSKLESFVVRRFSDPMRYNFSGLADIVWKPEDKAVTLQRSLWLSIKQLNK